MVSVSPFRDVLVLESDLNTIRASHRWCRAMGKVAIKARPTGIQMPW